ncbi:hypothetical protein ABAC402_10615 [Asticcacaulis sp. AC402]|nr:hypothetical protein ABAC402_10615 [Asticcacaulis sp. AC402]
MKWHYKGPDNGFTLIFIYLTDDRTLWAEVTAGQGYCGPMLLRLYDTRMDGGCNRVYT